MATRNGSTRYPYRSEAHWWGDIHAGEPAALIAAGILQPEWLLEKPHKGRRVEYPLEGGRTASVHRKGRGLVEVQIYVPVEEQRRREAALAAEREAVRLANRQRLAPLRAAHERAIAAIAACLQKRYPDVRVWGVELLEGHDGMLTQKVAFIASAERLVERGLATMAMIEHEMRSDQRRGPRILDYTPLGCSYSVFDARGQPFLGDELMLTIYTRLAPGGPDNFSLGEARRALASIMRRTPSTSGGR